MAKASQLEINKNYSLQYFPAEDAIKVKAEDGSEKGFKVSEISNLEWGSVEAQNGKLKYIVISIKSERSPIILHSSTEAMELWFDALRMMTNPSASEDMTQSSITRMKSFEKAAIFGSKTRSNVVEIPPPPSDYNFVEEFESLL